MKRLGGLLLLAICVAGCSKEEPKAEIRETTDNVKSAVRGIFRVENAGASEEDKPRMVPLDVAGLTAKEVKAEFAKFRHPESTHLWMPGEQSWLLVERASTNAVPLDVVMEAVATDGACTLAFPEIFASYVGTLAEVMPAFEAELIGEAVPEWFVTKEIPNLEWITNGEVDEDIAELVRHEIRSMQVIRRLVLEGNMLSREAKDKAGEEAATEKWAAAFLRNPHDPILQDRLIFLERNARGFVEVGKVLQAMKCYETIILINPKDAAAVRNFGHCLRNIGREDMAKEVLKHAEELAR